MAKVTAADVNKLRKSTGAGMMDCKKALEEAENDFDKAIEFLRKKGQKVAAKRADRESAEGAAIAKTNKDSTKGVILSLNCETDFVAKNEGFVKLANDLTELALDYSTKEEFLKAQFNDSLTVEEKLTEQTGVIGEKLEIGGYETLEANYVGGYIHAGNKIAALTGLSSDANGAEQVAKDVSMQAAAMDPIALNEESVPQNIVDKELEIAKEQIKKEGKPENLWDKIAQGKLKRYFKDNTLVNQVYIKDNKTTVAQYVATLGKEVKVTGFKRVALG